MGKVLMFTDVFMIVCCIVMVLGWIIMPATAVTTHDFVAAVGMAVYAIVRRGN